MCDIRVLPFTRKKHISLSPFYTCQRDYIKLLIKEMFFFSHKWKSKCVSPSPIYSRSLVLLIHFFLIIITILLVHIGLVSSRLGTGRAIVHLVVVIIGFVA